MADSVSLSVATAVMLTDGVWITLQPGTLSAVIDPSFTDPNTGQQIVPGEAWMQFIDGTGQAYAAPMRCVCGVKLAGPVGTG